MDYTRQKVYLAALLHDIGKFYQRADEGSVQNSLYLKNFKDEHEPLYCPVYEGKYSHKHVLWTAQFIKDKENKLKKIIGSSGTEKEFEELLNWAACHHLNKEQLNSKDEFGQIIKEADCLSSGMDRDSSLAFKDAQDENDWKSFKRKRMFSILETIGLKENNLSCKDDWKLLPITWLHAHKDVFPKNKGDFKSDPDYKTLYDKFNKEFDNIKADTYKAFSETLLNLLYKYTSFIPSSTIHFRDVSLFDHLKTTAAIATCLYDVKNARENEDVPFLLVGADISGIQAYIYQIISKHAAKNLKGRSYYIKLISDAIVRYLLKQLELYQANIIYNSGGGFYLLAPNTQKCKNELTKSIKYIEEKLFEHHGTQLFVAIDWIEIDKNTLLRQGKKNLSDSWREIHDKFQRKKESKYASLIEENYSKFFEPQQIEKQDIGTVTKIDAITGEDFFPGEKIHKDEWVYSNGETEDIFNLKEITREQLELGKNLKDFNIIAVSEDKVPYWENKSSINPLKLDFYYYFLNEKEINEMNDKLKGSADSISIISFNGECELGNNTLNGCNNIYGFDFYGGTKDSTPITNFEKLCKKESEDAFERLGVLRMDVDNLGLIFREGFASERVTLSRYSSLSRSLDFFFCGYINNICKEIAKEQSFILYSGGDDLFIVGSWDKTIEIAKKIQKDFTEFTCHNKDYFSISGGIAIVTNKFPIMKGAEYSAEEEELAKNHTCKMYEKNSISFMKTPLNWKYEFDTVYELKEDITKLISNEEGSLPKSFIHKVLTHYTNADIKNHSVTNYKTYWMLTYDLNRLLGRIKNDNKHYEECKTIINNCIKESCSFDKEKTICKLNGKDIETDYHPMELWAFACRWAELENRNKINN